MGCSFWGAPWALSVIFSTRNASNRGCTDTRGTTLHTWMPRPSSQMWAGVVGLPSEPIYAALAHVELRRREPSRGWTEAGERGNVADACCLWDRVCNRGRCPSHLGRLPLQYSRLPASAAGETPDWQDDDDRPPRSLSRPQSFTHCTGPCGAGARIKAAAAPAASWGSPRAPLTVEGRGQSLPRCASAGIQTSRGP